MVGLTPHPNDFIGFSRLDGGCDRDSVSVSGALASPRASAVASLLPRGDASRTSVSGSEVGASGALLAAAKGRSRLETATK
ncbi:MAG: hypothetical protein PUP91_39170 [Rhizonema sp. PD37]|nr:hypothetical protein [Rhizonema sp. PD37]